MATPLDLIGTGPLDAPEPRTERAPGRSVSARREGRIIFGVDVVSGGAAALAVGTSLAPTLARIGCATALLAWCGDYRRPRVALSAMRELPRLVSRLGVVIAGMAVAAAVWGAADESRGVVVASGFLLLGRFVSFGVLRRLRRRGVISSATLVVGAGTVGRDLMKHLAGSADYGMRVLGVVDDPEEVHDLQLLGGLEDLSAVVCRTRAERVLVTFGVTRDWRLIEVIRNLPGANLEVLVVPRLFEIGTGEYTADDVEGIPLVWIPRRSARAVSWRVKRGVDVVLAAVLLVLAAPALVLCAVAVRATSRGPVLFRQERIGQDGRSFTLLKFRSMRPNGDSATLWSVRDDHRLTTVGRWLRRTNLDELPQLYNILRGDMSLVGPRPERPYFVERFSRTFPGYGHRHRSPAGLTGWAQIHGLRGDTSIEERVRFDNYYIDNWSLWSDVTILVRTIRAISRRDRA
ncbi:MAG: exopolysaccharide biosynthesis polyprenyl glycosylphosphotransferase [Acidimicrobiia bacterium]|nr:exopolysaccharide biosynthesis polyprenyl glycosylphosphotransferase [Acidimicrobiia bacterium]